MKPTFAVVIWEDAMMAGHWQGANVFLILLAQAVHPK